MQTTSQYLNTIGRILLAAIFLISGFSKISGYEATQEYMAYVGVPIVLLPLVIAFEISAALALIVGFKSRTSALALAAFSLLTAILFHNDLDDQTQFIMFLKNAAITGGLLFVAANGPGTLAVDSLRYGRANS